MSSAIWMTTQESRSKGPSEFLPTSRRLQNVQKVQMRHGGREALRFRIETRLAIHKFVKNTDADLVRGIGPHMRRVRSDP